MMKSLPLSLLVLPILWSTHAQDDCTGICGRRPLASSHASTRIVGGTDALPGTWPWQVSIQIPSYGGYRHICGGSLISSRWVMTAAHCFGIKSYLTHWKVVVGFTQISRPGPNVQERFIKTLYEHEMYNARGYRNDIAVVELNKPVTCNDYVQPACLPDEYVNVPSLPHCWVSGWGVPDYEKNPHQTSDIMQEARVDLIPLELCNSTFWYAGQVWYNNLCAGYEEGGIDTCQGDSGGPLACRESRSERFWIVGITSWGSGCARARRPGVYSATQFFINWIKEKTKENFFKPFRPVILRPKPKPKTTTSTPRPYQVFKPISQNDFDKLQNEIQNSFKKTTPKPTWPKPTWPRPTWQWPISQKTTPRPTWPRPTWQWPTSQRTTPKPSWTWPTWQQPTSQKTTPRPTWAWPTWQRPTSQKTTPRPTWTWPTWQWPSSQKTTPKPTWQWPTSHAPPTQPVTLPPGVWAAAPIYTHRPTKTLPAWLTSKPQTWSVPAHWVPLWTTRP